MFFLFNKTISLFYSLFVFRLCYKIISLSSLNLVGRGLEGPRAYPSLACRYGPGLGLKLAGWTRPGPNIRGLGRAWAGHGPKF